MKRTICHDLGLITMTLHPSNVLRPAPPLTIDHPEIETMVAIIDRALMIYKERTAC